ncbi:hypothetical protein LCGC14_1676870 [marine sediment metagenome]|uniref:Uncharacterized protein n=1 Tax=marine sediment metagenome TaxID=412755 RepID=A0A0F9K5F0_9ZZZZ
MEKTNPLNIKEIKHYSLEYHTIFRDWNRLSSSSKFYYHHGVVYEDAPWGSDISIRSVENPEKLHRLRNKISKFIKDKEYKELGFMTWIKEACSDRGLVDKGVYKFRVPELCKIEKVKKHIYETEEEFFLFCFFEIKSKDRYKDYFKKDTWDLPEPFVIPFYEKKHDRVGFFTDYGKLKLDTYNTQFHLIDYEIYKGYMEENKENVNIPVRDEMLQGNLFKENTK